MIFVSNGTQVCKPPSIQLQITNSEQRREGITQKRLFDRYSMICTRSHRHRNVFYSSWGPISIFAPLPAVGLAVGAAIFAGG